MARSGRPVTPLYQPVDWMMVRTPLLPVEHYLGLAQRAGSWPTESVPGTLVPADPRIRRAIAVGGGDLMRALEHPPTDQRGRDRLAGKLSRYLIRMSTRPTPYGLFAGVALGTWGDRTDVALASRAPQIRARPDMGWLVKLITELENQPEIRAGLHWSVNPAAFVHEGRVRLTERPPGGDAAHVGKAVSVRATAPVLRALAVAQRPVRYPALVQELQAATGADVDRVGRLLAQLWAQGILLTDLRPPLTTVDPARHVQQRLTQIPGLSLAGALDELLDAMAEWDLLDVEEGAGAYGKLVASAQALHSLSAGEPSIQVDMAIPLARKLVSSAVALEAATAAELLLRLSPFPSGLPQLDMYRRAFFARYGRDREGPILELLDPEVGLGPPRRGHGSGLDHAREALRHRTLLTLALDAIRDGAAEVELTKDTIERLQTWEPSVANAPASLDVSAFVAADSPEAVDAGEFCLVIGPNLGASAAGRNLGRFADVLGPEADSALRRVAAKDDTLRLWAEVVYQPWRARSANVAVRPLVREWTIEVDTGALAMDGAAKSIPVRELMIGVRNGRFVVRWPAMDVEVVPCAGHMLNNMQAPTVARFLDQVSRDRRVQTSHFDWGPAAEFPFLPRVRVGKILLALAQWRVDATTLHPSPERFAASLAQWRGRWRAPRHVYLAAGDNRLMLDLDQPQQAEHIRVELQKLSGSRQLLLEEAFPGPDQAWLPGPGGRFMAELVVPVIARRDPDGEQNPQRQPSHVAVAGAPASVRLRPPGTDWLYVKLYHTNTFDEKLLSGPLREFSTDMCAAGFARDWFFIRYSDPEPHIRLRFRGEPDVLSTVLAPEVFRWAAELLTDGLCRHYSLETYDREVERYGGPAAMSAAETLFAADSVAVAALLESLISTRLTVDRHVLAAYTVDDLLAGLGFDQQARTQWYGEQVTDRRRSGADYRKYQRRLRAMLGGPDGLSREPGGAAVDQTLATRRATLARVVEQLDEFEVEGLLQRPKHQLAQSYVHMHCNRLLSGGPSAEEQVLGLLLRTHESLAHAPLVL